MSTRWADKIDRMAGHFGDWMRRTGHGNFIEWRQDASTKLWTLDVVRDAQGRPLAPRTVAPIEYAIKMAIGHSSTPKGGDLEYRNC